MFKAVKDIMPTEVVKDLSRSIKHKRQNSIEFEISQTPAGAESLPSDESGKFLITGTGIFS